MQEAKDVLAKFKDRGIDPQKDENLQITINKLMVTERNNEDLKVLNHQLAQRKDQMKKDLFVLDKKYKKSLIKIKKQDEDLKETKQQVSEFKQRLKTLSTFIQKKGGIEVINQLPETELSPMYSETTSKYNDIDDSRTNFLNQKKILRGQAPSQNPKNSNKITVRGGGGKVGSPSAPNALTP